MSKNKDSKQPTLAAFMKKKSDETSSAVPVTETSSIISEALSSTSEAGSIDTTTINVNVTLNVTADTEETEINADAQIIPNGPTDITSIGTLKTMKPQVLPVGLKYPVTDGRKFKPTWLAEYVWLEYSISQNAAFCYACRQFSTSHDRDNVFKSTGYSQWKTALESKKGFKKHQSSAMHLSSMGKWSEAITREKNKTSVHELASGNVLQYRRDYVKKIIEVIIFMVSNELAFRGTYDIEKHMDDGLFEKVFAYTKNNNENLRKWETHMPQHYTYRSPDIQNEIIKLLASMVREMVANDVMNSDVPFFTLLEDGTKDKHNKECVAIAARYVKDGEVKESIITMETFSQLNAAYFATHTLKILEENGIDNERMLSQCYDGASVMSGKDGGVQKLIQDKLQRKIPYFHCLNHQCHLCIIKAIESVPMVKQFFDQAKLIAKFFRRHKVREYYDGHSVLKLIETRWIGHLRASKSIFENYEHIMKTLPQITAANGFDGDDVALAAGLFHVMASLEFVFTLVFIKDLLQTIEPVTKALQGREIGYKDSIAFIRAVIKTIEKMRSQECFQKYYSQAENMLENSKDSAEVSQRPTRNRCRSTMLLNSVVEETLGERSEKSVEMKSAYYETIDIVLMEMTNRFEKNDNILSAIDTADEMDLTKLQALTDLGIKLPNENELKVAKEYIDSIRANHEELNKLKKPGDKKIITNVLAELYKVRQGMQNVYNLFAIIETFASGTAACESSFSTLTRIMRPQRVGMSTERLNNLAYLAFEYKRLESLDLNIVLKRFDALKNRKVQLF